jgi:ABC-2 type transport system permease protein
MFENDKVEQTLEQASAATQQAAGVYLPARWFSDAVTRLSPLGMLLLIGVSALLFALVFRIVGKSYRNINSALKSHAASKSYRMTALKQRSVPNAIAFKEFRRLTGSTTYMTNGAMGEVMAALLGLLTLAIGFDKIIGVVTHNAPIDTAILQPAIPFIIYFFIGMMATTVCSPSLEGKNYWILQSLPVDKKTVYQGKMLFNMYLTVPFMAFATLCMCVSAKAPALDTALYLLLGLALCAFSTAWGCVCGIRHMRLDWENEIEVIKQGAGVAIYLLPNMFVCMGLVVLVVILGLRIDRRLLTAALTLIAGVLAALCYRRALILAEKRG